MCSYGKFEKAKKELQKQNNNKSGHTESQKVD